MLGKERQGKARLAAILANCRLRLTFKFVSLDSWQIIELPAAPVKKDLWIYYEKRQHTLAHTLPLTQTHTHTHLHTQTQQESRAQPAATRGILFANLFGYFYDKHTNTCRHTDTDIRMYTA